jgi:hypothetical protein
MKPGMRRPLRIENVRRIPIRDHRAEECGEQRYGDQASSEEHVTCFCRMALTGLVVAELLTSRSCVV